MPRTRLEQSLPLADVSRHFRLIVYTKPRQEIERFPWLSEADLEKLAKKPWLELYLEAGDLSLDEAVKRHRAVQERAKVELRKRGKEPHRRMVVRGGIQTTAYEDPIHREMN